MDDDNGLWRVRSRVGTMEWVYTEDREFVRETIALGWEVQILEVKGTLGLGAVLAVKA